MAKQKSSAASAKTPAPTTPSSMFPLTHLRDDIDRAFDRMFKDWPRLGGLVPTEMLGGDYFGRASAAAPRVDVSEDDDGYEIVAEMPGVEEKDVDVTVKDERLTIRGEKKSEREEKKKDYHMTERSFGSFERSFRLPSDIDPDKIKAEFAKGVLTLSLPKTPEAKTQERKIAIKAK